MERTNELKPMLLGSVYLDDRSYVLLENALYWLRKVDHEGGCPALRDDYGCSCGLDDTIAELAEILHTQDEQCQLAEQMNQQAQQALTDEER